MTARFWTSDLHLGHRKVSEIRGFETTDEHDAAIQTAWHRQVKPDDEVFVLGDLSSGFGEDRALAIIADLPGRKHLVAGNHDSVSSTHRDGYRYQKAFLEVFESVQQFARVRVRGRDAFMSHYPYASQGDGPGRGAPRHLQFRLPDLGELLIHGHTHHSDPFSGSTTGREMCVSWDAWGRLVGQKDIDDWVKSRMEIGE